MPDGAQARARIVARKPGVVAGLGPALLAFRLLDDAIECATSSADGAPVAAGECVAEIRGRARTILTGERTALNFLCRLSGIATATRMLVDLLAGTHARVADTRKTTPGLRALEKYAVRCGGGDNHRFGLDDAVLVKDNHLALAGSIHAAVAAVRARVGHTVKVEVEVDTLDQLREALEEPIDAVLLDNMTPEQLARAVHVIGGRVLAEASGGVTRRNDSPDRAQRGRRHQRRLADAQRARARLRFGRCDRLTIREQRERDDRADRGDDQREHVPEGHREPLDASVA